MTERTEPAMKTTVERESERSARIAVHPCCIALQATARRLNQVLPDESWLDIQTGWEITNQRGWKGRGLADIRRIVCVEGPAFAVKAYAAEVSSATLDQRTQASACTASVLALGVAAARFMNGADLRAAHGTIRNALEGGHVDPVTNEMLAPDHHDWAMAGMLRNEMPHRLTCAGVFLSNDYLPVERIPDVLAAIPRIRDAYRARSETVRAREHPL